MSLSKPAEHQDAATLHPTAQRLVDYSLNVVDTVGVQGIHVTDLLEATNISVGSFYHHFSNREELLRVTLEQRFIQTLAREISRFAAQINQLSTIDEIFAAVTQRQFVSANDPASKAERFRRIEILGYAFSSPEALHTVAGIQRNAMGILKSILESAQDRGLVRREVNPEQYTGWFAGMQMGRILADITPISDAQNALWTEYSLQAMFQPLIPREELERLHKRLSVQESAAVDLSSQSHGHSEHRLWPERSVPLYRLHQTARTLVEATMLTLDQVGEDGLRVEQILHDTGISVGSLYHHFRDREGLLIAADTQRFISTAPESIDAFAFAAQTAETTEEFLDLLAANIISTANDQTAKFARKRQIEVLATALSRPQLLTNIIAAQRNVVTYVSRIFDRAKQRRLIRQDLDTEAYVLWLLGMQFGQTLSDIDPLQGGAGGWTTIAVEAACAPLRPVATE